MYREIVIKNKNEDIEIMTKALYNRIKKWRIRYG